MIGFLQYSNLRFRCGVRGLFQAKIDTNIKQGEHTIYKDFFFFCIQKYIKKIFLPKRSTLKCHKTVNQRKNNIFFHVPLLYYGSTITTTLYVSFFTLLSFAGFQYNSLVIKCWVKMSSFGLEKSRRRQKFSKKNVVAKHRSRAGGKGGLCTYTPLLL